MRPCQERLSVPLQLDSQLALGDFAGSEHLERLVVVNFQPDRDLVWVDDFEDLEQEVILFELVDQIGLYDLEAIVSIPCGRDDFHFRLQECEGMEPPHVELLAAFEDVHFLSRVLWQLIQLLLVDEESYEAVLWLSV